MKRRKIRSWSSMTLAAVALVGLCGPSASLARPITAPGSIPDYYETPNWANSPPLTKFVDTLAPLGCETPTPLGQCLPVAASATYPYNGDANGSDYYEIAIVEYREQMHSDLLPLRDAGNNLTTVKTAAYGDPAAAVSGGTLLRGYVQEVNGVPVTQPHYLGPVIVAQKDRPVRIKFINRLPTGAGGDLFVPVDTSIMGSGEYEINYNPETKALLGGNITGTFTQNRAELHLHGGRTPWISDGTPHQWITPEGDAAAASYPKGVGVAYVPDMWYDATSHAEIVGCRGQNTCGVGNATNNPGPGAQTYYFTNAQSARLMFYHDHSWGITRLNVYVGGAAGYLIEDQTEADLFAQAPLNALAGTLPLIIQDKTFVDPTTIKDTDPTWAWGSSPSTFVGTPTESGQGMTPVLGDLWWPHVYMPAQNPFNPNMSGINDMGRWHYGPWFFPATPVCGSSPDAVKPLCIDFGPVENVHYRNDPNCFPVETAQCTQPPLMPGTPNVSWGAEAFLDTMMVNGTVYPTKTVQPGTYRLRILNASHDRFLNLQFYQAEPMSVAVTNGGTGYTAPPAVTITGGGGSGATAEATITGTVTGATVVSGGSGYTSPPTVTIAGAGTGATATASIGNGVSRIYPTDGGSGYASAPTVTFDGGGCTVAPTATAFIEGYVDSISIPDGGSGYTSDPTIILEGGGGIGSELVSVTRVGGVITAINVTPGVQYTSPPTVVISGGGGTGATATANIAGFVTDIAVTASGTCTSAPNVTLGAPGGGGDQAYARAIYGSGVVTAIAITNPGDGYSSGDTIIMLNGGGGTGASATASVTGVVTGIAVTNPGAGYTSAPTVTVAAPGAGVQATATAYLGTEVKMVPAAATAGFPPSWPADGREGGVPDPAYRGPAFLQFATEGGFLPAPVVLNNQPVTWNVDPTMFNVGNVLNQRDGGGTLFLGPAERADVLVDFSQYAGRTLILYNDAPTAFPALDPHYDYYTGAPDRTDIGGFTAIQAGKGPNIRTVMQIKVGEVQTYPSTPTVNDAVDEAALTTMQTAFAGTTGVFATGQDPIVVGQTAYNSNYCSGGNLFPATYPNWGLSRISDSAISFMKPEDCTTIVSNYMMKPKAIQDEMGETFDDYGRMSAKLGLEVPFTNAAVANFILQNYVDPSTEIVRPGETQIWRITHNGVDVHPIHFHLFDVQVLNRVGWDGFIRIPDDNELGWKDTVRVAPLEDTIVALRPIAPPVPFGLPNSIRPLNPEAPIGSDMGFSNVDPTTGGNLATPTVNKMADFGHEYVWHCHILSHEENDMMRAIIMQVPHNDFNGDGTTDIVWQKNDGSAMIWKMNGTSYLFTANLAVEPDTNWKIVAAADFNHDYKPDLLWRNISNGNNRVWLMDGAVLSSSVAINAEAVQAWQIAATGDLNNDGNVDIIWRNTSNGQNRVWLMNGTTFMSTAALPVNNNPQARIVGTGDFNYDGKIDILWRNGSTGSNFIWLMNGTSRTANANLPANTNASAQIFGTGDFNLDGKVDVLWRNVATGSNFVWLMDGVTRTANANLQPFAAPASTGWSIVGR